MVLAADISRAFHSVTVADASPAVAAHLHTLVIDALACIVGGAETEIAEIARLSVAGNRHAGAAATVLPSGLKFAAKDVALVNGTALRSQDLMDVFVDADVSHPSESIPATLACAEAAGASGRDFLDAVLAACALHVQLATKVPLHRNALHHVGHAAWTVPLIAARLAGRGEDLAANALNLSASGIIVPEGFSRGHVANVKGMAFPMIARRAIELDALSALGLAAQPGACEEVVRLLGLAMGKEIAPADLVPSSDPSRIMEITLKAYPAQYALQPLVAAGAAFHRANPAKIADIQRIDVRAMKQTVSRTADPAKFRPTSQEAADHSLPFCIASGLVDGGLTVDGLHGGRWKDDDILRLTGCMHVEAMEGGEGFAVGKPEIKLTFGDGTTADLDCEYPGARSWRDIATGKLAAVCGDAASNIIDIIEGLADMPSVQPLIGALLGDGAAQKRAS